MTVKKGIKQRRTYANYISVGVADTYEFMGAGFTELNETPAAQTSSKRYINDKSATKAVTGYDWSTPFVTDFIRSEAAVEFIVNIGEKQLTGVDCETDYVIVDLDKKEETGTSYSARKFKVAVAVASFDNNDGELSASGDLLGVGDVILGKFDTETKKFTPEVE